MAAAAARGVRACGPRVRVAGYDPSAVPSALRRRPAEAFELVASTRPPPAPEPETGAARAPEDRRPVYYADLGPASLDVSAYGEEQRSGYDVYRRVCSRCHGLARSINSPRESGASWRRAVLRMRLNAHVMGRGAFSREQAAAAVRFLAYDSRARKIERRPAFERQQEALRRRFEALLEERMEGLQREGRSPRLAPD